MKVFPYFATPNMELQTVADSIDLAATPDEVWSLIGPFAFDWHPLVVKATLTGTGIGQLRTLGTLDGGQVIERLEAIDDTKRFYRYTQIAGLSTSRYVGTLEVKPNGGGSIVDWRVQFLADNKPDIIVKDRVSRLIKAGFESLKSRFGVRSDRAHTA